MRFKAKIVQITAIQHLIKVLGTVSKVAKTCVICLSSSQLSFITTDRLAGGGVSLWCELNQENFFDEYRIEGKDERNEIYFEVIVDNIARAIKSAHNAQSVKLRLAKKQTACLVFEITLPSLTSHTRSVVHDVPINLIPSRFWEDYHRPQVSTYDVSTTLPNMRTMRSVVERLKNLSNFMILAANDSGQFMLQVQTDEATVTTTFKGVDFSQSIQSSQRPSQPMVEVRVEIQKVATLLQGQQLTSLHASCNIIDGQAVHFLFEGDGITLYYHVPGIFI